MASTISAPTNIYLAFASSGTKNTIPIPAQTESSGLASYTEGFPPLTFTDPDAGGTAPYGADFNGILYSITKFQAWVNAGGQFFFDSAISAGASGYPIGAVVMLSNRSASYINLVSGNTNDPNTIRTNWAPWGGAYALAGSYVATSGSSNAYSGTIYPTPSTYANGMIGTFKANFTNTGACTINLGAGAVALVRNDGAAVTAGDIVSSSSYMVIYDSTTSSFRLLGAVLSQMVPVGTITAYAGSTIPGGYLDCTGSAVSRTTYSALFAKIGTNYGSGDGSTTFNLPDFRGRTILGQGTGTGLTARALGDVGGEETHTLDITEIPSHNHLNGMADDGTELFVYGGSTSGMPGSATKTITSESLSATHQGYTGNAGGGGSHNNMQPFGVAKVIIKY